jgi:hypothetical protein
MHRGESSLFFALTRGSWGRCIPMHAHKGNTAYDRGKPKPQSKRVVVGIYLLHFCSSPNPAVFVSGFFKGRGRTLRPAYIFSCRSCDPWMGSELGIVAWYHSILVARVSPKNCNDDQHWVDNFTYIAGRPEFNVPTTRGATEIKQRLNRLSNKSSPILRRIHGNLLLWAPNSRFGDHDNMALTHVTC